MIFIKSIYNSTTRTTKTNHTRQTGRQTDRQTDRQAAKGTKERERERESTSFALVGLAQGTIELFL